MKIPRFRVCSLLATVLAAAPAWSAPGDVSPAQPVVPSRRFNLSDFGAVPDGTTSNTAAFKRAVAAVDAAGGGTLAVPAGTYFTGPFDLCSRIDFHLDAGAKLVFSPVFSDYADGNGKYRPLLLTSNAHDVIISGSGTIYGSGEAWWPEAERFKAAAREKHDVHNTSPRPRMVVFDTCKRVRVEGITLTHAPVFNLVPIECEDVTVEGVTILNPADSPNTDGIDPSVSIRVRIAHCTIDTGDDCIAVKAARGPLAPMHDILVEDCTFLHGHGCSVGSETYGGLRDMMVRRCTFDGTVTGIRFKSDRKRGGLVEDVIYEDLTMRNVGEAISVSSYYESSTSDAESGHERPQPVGPTTPHWRNLTIRNVTAAGCTRGAGLIQGLPEMPVESLTLEHVHIDGRRGLRLSNLKGALFEDVHIAPQEGPAVISDASVTGVVVR